MKAVNPPTVYEPLRHHNFVVAQEALWEKLGSNNGVILKGVEQSGKSTLAQTLMAEYHENKIPTAYITKALKKPSELYAHLSRLLKTGKTKKAIIESLHQLKINNEYCLLAIDQEGIDSSPQVKGILKQLCSSNNAILGAVKLLVVRQDYIVIPNKSLLEADFHNWITEEVTLKLLHESDIDSYIHHLATSRSVPVPAYALGTDTLLIELSDGRIGKLEAILTPVINQDVITAEDLSAPVVVVPKHRGQSPVILAGAISLLLAITLVIYLAISLQSKQEAEIEESKPIFADNSVPAPKIKAPYLSSGSASKKPTITNKQSSQPSKPEPPRVITEAKTSSISATIPKPAMLSQEMIIEDITHTIDHWLFSWQTQNLGAYIKHYVETFNTADSSHEEWRIQRQRSMSRPKWIKLQRSDLQDLLIEGDQVSLRFWLKFESSIGYRDRTLKKITLVQQNNQWLITSEINELVRRGF